MNSNSFGHDFTHAIAARSIDDEYRQIERMYGPRGTSWRFVRQSLSMGSDVNDARKYDIITIRLTNGQTRDVYFDITSFEGNWPDHAAGMILRGSEMNVSDITGAGQAAGGSTTSSPYIAIVAILRPSIGHHDTTRADASTRDGTAGP